jgi:hypothetical protein
VSNAQCICDSTISGNVAGDPRLDLFGEGGGVDMFYSGAVNVVNSTLSGNHATVAGGMGIQRGEATISNSTIAFNTTRIDAANESRAAGLYAQAYSIGLDSTVIAHNTAQGSEWDLSAAEFTAIVGSHNLVMQSSHVLPADTLAGDPLLGALADNGGATPTHALLSDSPAINRGSNPLHLSFDQRGNGYARAFGAAPDIGAFETGTAGDTILASGFD